MISFGMSHRAFTPEQDQMLAHEFLAGATHRELARKYGGTNVSVRNAVLRAGVTGEVKREALKSPLIDRDPEAMADALRLYRDGWSVKKLAQKYRCRDAVVSEVLAEGGAELHPGGRAHPIFRSDEACLRVALEYEEGAGLRELANKYHCTLPAIRRAILRAGGSVRSGGRREFWTPERVSYLIEQFKDGRSQESLAKEFGVHQTTISNRLRFVGAITPPPRPKGEAHYSYRGGAAFVDGYVSILVFEDDLAYCRPNTSGRVLEHRLVMGRALGRPLGERETVHHINGDRMDNRLENLQLRQGRHGNGVVVVCKSCGSHDVEAVEIAT